MSSIDGQAIIIDWEPDNNPVRARLHIRQALSQRDNGHLTSAIPLYESAIKLLRQSSEVLALASAIRQLADLHLIRKDYDIAEPLYNEALAIYRALDNTPPLALVSTLRPFALLHEALSDPHAARQLGTEAEALRSHEGVIDGIEECHRHLTTLAV